jgi:hypothetical protein
MRLAIVALILILAAIIHLLTRQSATVAGDPDKPTRKRASALLAGPAHDGSGGGPPSKSGARSERTKPRFITTSSGLRYEVLAEGSGSRPGPTDTVHVHYHGTTLDGVVFDSSVDRGKPTTLPLDRVIKGWTEGLQLMKVGSKYRFTIPPELAYGTKGAGDTIGPDETLVFEIELLEIPPPP